MVNDGDLKKLLQLKKFETPGREYFDHFVPEFHRYQRSAILKPSLGEVIAEKVSQLFEKMLRPIPMTGMATAAIVATVALAATMRDSRDMNPSEYAITYQNTAKGIVKSDFVNATVTYSDPLIQEPELHHGVAISGSKDYQKRGGEAPLASQVALQYDSNLTF
jgi:hypothetical protein